MPWLTLYAIGGILYSVFVYFRLLPIWKESGRRRLELGTSTPAIEGLILTASFGTVVLLWPLFMLFRIIYFTARSF